MNILIFSDCYIYGGSEKLMSFLLKNEILNINNVLNFAYRKYKDYEKGLLNDSLLNRDNNYPLYLLSNETLFHNVNCKIKSNFLNKLIKLPFFIFEKIGIYFFWNLIVFIHLLYKTKPDLIHINNGGYPAAKSCNTLVVANYISFKIKVIYQVNNQASERSVYFEKFYDAFINNTVNYFINASHKAKQQLVEKRNFDDKKILVVNNCVPLPEIKLNREQIYKELNIPLDSFLLVEVAFLTERKGQKYLIDALNSLFIKKLLDREKVYCALVGNGEDEEFLKQYIGKLELSSNVFLLGYRNNSEDFIDACSLFLLPSIKDEDMPLVLLSALGYGKPIIATDFAGISQVIDSNENGILIENDLSNLKDNLASEINRLYHDEALRKVLGENAKRKYMDYSPKIYGAKLKEIYERTYNG